MNLHWIDWTIVFRYNRKFFIIVAYMSKQYVNQRLIFWPPTAARGDTCLPYQRNGRAAWAYYSPCAVQLYSKVGLTTTCGLIFRYLLYF